MTHSEYEMLMVNLAGGCPSAKPAQRPVKAHPADSAKSMVVVVQNDDSFREWFMERLFQHRAAVRIVG